MWLLLAALAWGADLPTELDTRWRTARHEASWRSPTVAERRAVRGALRALATGTCSPHELGPHADALEAVDLDLELIEQGDARVAVVWEGEGSHRGAGLFAVRCGPAEPWVFQAPHPLYESGTRPLTLRLFAESGARALTWATVHRYRALPDEQPEDRVHPADVTRQHGSLFQAATAGLASGDPTLRFVQVHGFSRPQSFAWSAVVSHGYGGLPPRGLAEAMGPLLGPTAAYGEDTQELGGTVNVQGRHLARTKGPVRFLHLELGPPARQALVEDESTREALLELLEPPW